MPQVFVLQGENIKTIYPLKKDITSLGSGENCDIAIDAESDHQGIYLEIQQNQKSYKLYNKQKSTQVLVNNVPGEKFQLFDGDIVSIGKTLLLFSHPEVESSSLDESIADATERMLETLGPVEREQRQLITLYKISNLLFYTFDLQELLQSLANILVETFSANNCSIFWRDSHLDCMRPMITYRDQEIGSVDISIEELKAIYQKKQALLWYKSGDGESFLVMGAPLLNQDEVIGFITLSAKKNVFVDEDLRLLSAIALLVANGIGSIQRYLERKEHLHRLEMLNQITLKLSSLLSLQDIYKETAREICHVLRCAKSAVMLLDPENYLRVKYSLGMKLKHSENVRVPIGKGLAGWVVAQGRSILSSEIPEVLKPTQRKKYFTESFVIVPIFDHTGSEPKTIGILSATDRVNGTPFSLHDREIMTFLAEQVGVALTNASLFEHATIDHLTKLYIRGHLFEKLEKALSESQVNGEPFSLLLLDLDHFKSINDTYGHQTGDVILSELGKLIKGFIRENDIAGRYGGEEFIIAFRNTGYKKALRIANRLCELVREHSFNIDSDPLRATVSIGVAESSQGDVVEDVILRGDRAMYRAKESGRDRVC